MSLILLEEEFPQNFVLSFDGWHPEICTNYFFFAAKSRLWFVKWHFVWTPNFECWTLLLKLNLFHLKILKAQVSREVKQKECEI